MQAVLKYEQKYKKVGVLPINTRCNVLSKGLLSERNPEIILVAITNAYLNKYILYEPAFLPVFNQKVNCKRNTRMKKTKIQV